MIASEQLTAVITKALDDMKAIDIQILDVRKLTSMTDTMIIASGGSDRQIRALANTVIDTARENGVRPLGTEGEQSGEWILVDLGDVVAHLMHPTSRAYYQLEKLWSGDFSDEGRPEDLLDDAEPLLHGQPRQH